MTASPAATFTTVAALLATLLATALTGTGRAVAAPVTDPLIDQVARAGYRNSAMRSPPAGLWGFESDFIGVAAPAARAALVGYRVPASVGTAQAILESGWGRSPLS